MMTTGSLVLLYCMLKQGTSGTSYEMYAVDIFSSKVRWAIFSQDLHSFGEGAFLHPQSPYYFYEVEFTVELRVLVPGSEVCKNPESLKSEVPVLIESWNRLDDDPVSNGLRLTTYTTLTIEVFNISY